MKITKNITLVLKQFNVSIDYKPTPDFTGDDISNFAVFIEDEEEQEMFVEKLMTKFPEITQVVVSIMNESTIYER